jgi:hypothetical protein
MAATAAVFNLLFALASATVVGVHLSFAFLVVTAALAFATAAAFVRVIVMMHIIRYL